MNNTDSGGDELRVARVHLTNEQVFASYARLHTKINAIGDVMENNIHLLTNRYESMEDIQEGSDQLKTKSMQFERTARRTLTWRQRVCRYLRRHILPHEHQQQQQHQ